MHRPWLLVLVGCAPIDTDALPFTQDGPPPQHVVSAGEAPAHDPLIVGMDATISAPASSLPGTTAFYASRAGTSPGAGPCLPAASGPACLDLEPATHLLGRVSHGATTPSLSVRIPAAMPPGPVWIQSVTWTPSNLTLTTSWTAEAYPGAPDEVDADGDGYCEGPVCARPGDLPGDCNDASAEVYPGQTRFFGDPVPVGPYSFDYNCDGIDESMPYQQYTCTPGPQVGDPCASFTPGVRGTVACGWWGWWESDCVTTTRGCGSVIGGDVWGYCR